MSPIYQIKISTATPGKTTIVYVWSQYDGGNIEQRTIGYGCRQNQEAKLKNCGRSNSLIQPTRSWSNQSLYNICNCAITFSTRE